MAPSGKIHDSLPNSAPRRAARLGHSAPAGAVVDLRKLLAERFPHPPFSAITRLVTGLSFLDQAIGGGLPKGAITELTTPQISAGSASLIQALLQTANRDHFFLALIDGRDSFDPQPLGNALLHNLFWVRCTTALKTIKAADLLLRDGNFPLVIVDLVLNPSEDLKIPQTTWYRLQRLVEPTSTACLVLTRRSMVSSAQLKIVLKNSWTLETFQKADAIAQLNIRIQRSHLHQLGNERAETN
jgi:recA bacterial DNA recombination protein